LRLFHKDGFERAQDLCRCEPNNEQHGLQLERTTISKDGLTCILAPMRQRPQRYIPRGYLPAVCCHVHGEVGNRKIIL
jgi:hypothetical protein